MDCNKHNIEEVVFSLTGPLGRVEELLWQLSDGVPQAKRSVEFREELKEAKQLFQSEYKRLEKGGRSISREIEAFYSPAMRDAAVRFPPLNRPTSWFSGLYEVQSDITYWLHGAKRVLAELSGDGEATKRP